MIIGGIAAKDLEETLGKPLKEKIESSREIEFVISNSD